MLKVRPYPRQGDKCGKDVERWLKGKIQTDRAVAALDRLLTKNMDEMPQEGLPFALIKSGRKDYLLTMRPSDTEAPFEINVVNGKPLIRLPFLFTPKEIYIFTVQGELGAAEREVKPALRRLKDILHALEELLSRTVFMLSPTSNYYTSQEHIDGVGLPFSIYENLFEGRGEREVVVDGVAEEGYLKFALGAYPYVEECGRGKGYSIPARPLKRRKRNREVRAVALFPEEVEKILKKGLVGKRTLF